MGLFPVKMVTAHIKLILSEELLYPGVMYGAGLFCPILSSNELIKVGHFLSRLFGESRKV